MKKYGKLNKFLSFLPIFAIIISTLCTGYIVSGEGGAIDYDAKIRALEEQAKEIAEKNKRREGEIAEIQNDIAQQEYFITLVKDEIEGVKEKINVQTQIINEQQNRITQKQIEIEGLEQDIVNTELEIERKREEIVRLNKENDENVERFGQIIKTMYMTGDFDTVSMLMGSTDFFDLLVRTEILQNVGERNREFMTELLASVDEQNNLIEKLEEEEQELAEKKAACSQEKIEMESELEILLGKKQELEAESAAEEQRLNQYAGERAELKGLVSEIKGEIDADNQVVEAVNAEVAALIKEKQRAAAATQKVYSTDGFIWPLDNNFKSITTFFGYDPWRKGNHYGIDVGNGGINGANIYAVQAGTVRMVVIGGADVYGGGYGNYMVIDHGGGVSTLYAHMQPWSPKFAEGDTVEQGDAIGLVGSTGWATGPHLHFEVRIDGTAVDPFNYSYA